MRFAPLGVLTFALACGSSDDLSRPGGTAGTASSGGSAMQPNGGSTNVSGTASSGGGGGGVAGAPMAGASSGGGEPTGGGGAGAGMTSGGRGGAGGSSAGAAGSSAGSGGGSSCVKNLGCKLDPPPSTGDLQQDCVDRINQFLTQCACLPALKRRTDGEACANQMAKYDADQNSPHAGVIAKICQPGGSQNSCPGYSSNAQVVGLCMQQMWDEGPPPTDNCTGECYETHGHFINMTDDSVTQVACGFYTTSSGKVWAVQNFSR